MGVFFGHADQAERHHADMGAATDRFALAGSGDGFGDGFRDDRHGWRGGGGRYNRRRYGIGLRWPQRQAAMRWTPDFVQQFLCFDRRCGIQHIGQHRAAAVISLHRQAAFAPCRMGFHQGAPGAFVRPVDRQQSLCRGDRGIGFQFALQHRLGDAARTVAQPFAFVVQPGVKIGVDPVQIFQQVAVQQRQGVRLQGGRPHHLFHIDPNRAGTQHQLVAGDDQHLGFRRRQRIQQPMDFLTQRGSGLLFRTPAPKLFGQTAAQHRAGCGHGDGRQQGAGFPAGGQHAFAANRPGFHLADQAQPHDDVVQRVGWHRRDGKPGCVFRHYSLGTIARL